MMGRREKIRGNEKRRMNGSNERKKDRRLGRKEREREREAGGGEACYNKQFYVVRAVSNFM